MAGGAKIIDFQQAAKRLAKQRKVEPPPTAITRIEQVKRVTLEEIEKALREHPDLDYLREKGVDAAHISAWLERFPAMTLPELISILKYAVRQEKAGGNDRIIDYLFRPLYE